MNWTLQSSRVAGHQGQRGLPKSSIQVTALAVVTVSLLLHHWPSLVTASVYVRIRALHTLVELALRTNIILLVVSGAASS